MTAQNISSYGFRGSKSLESFVKKFSGVTIAVKSILFGILLFSIISCFSYISAGNLESISFESILSSLFSGLLIWVMSNSSIITINSVSFQFIPLGGTLLVMLLIYLCAKSTKNTDPKALLIGVFFYAFLVFLLSFVVKKNNDVSGLNEMRSFIFAFFISVVCFFMGNVEGSIFDKIRNSNRVKLSRNRWYSSYVLISAIRASIIGVTILLFVGCIITIFSTFANHQTTYNDISILNTNPFATFMVGLDEILILPNIIIWNVSLILGTGLDFGYAQRFDQIPLPILNSIDLTIGVSHIIITTWVLLILVGAICAMLVWRWTKDAFFVFGYSDKMIRFGKVAYFFASIILSGLFFFIGFYILSEISSGSIHFGTLGYIGIHSYTFAIHGCAGFVLGELIMSIPLCVVRIFEKPDIKNTSIFKVKAYQEIKKIKPKKRSRTYEVIKKQY